MKFELSRTIGAVVALLFTTLPINAQEMLITSFKPAVSDQSAKTSQRLDANGTPCALVKVFIPDNITSVDGEAVGETVVKDREKWVYLCDGVKHFTLNLERHYPVEVSFTKYDMAHAESSCVYILNISDAKGDKGLDYEGTRSDDETSLTAEELYKKAIDFYYGNEDEPDLSQAVVYFQKAAEQGHVVAQRYLGICYENGEGVTQDYSQAVTWYKKAAEQWDADAQCALGYCYEKGHGITQDYSQAVSWYRKAAEQGHINAQYDLGYCYHMGLGVPQDYSQAVSWYRKAADQGHVKAQCNLGYCYSHGQGVAMDYSQAVSWYRKAAEQGSATAQDNLGQCYRVGRGVEKDYKQAFYWYKKSAEQGYADAQYQLGNLYYYRQVESITSVPINIDRSNAVLWYKKAAEQGHKDAQFNLAGCYKNGFGVTQDYKQAAYWYTKAAEQGDDGAKGQLKMLKDEGKI